MRMLADDAVHAGLVQLRLRCHMFNAMGYDNHNPSTQTVRLLGGLIGQRVDHVHPQDHHCPQDHLLHGLYLPSLP